MLIGKPSDIAVGGTCAWQLPPDPNCAQLSRTLIRSAMAELGLPGKLIDDVTLSVSELATNAHGHCARLRSFEPTIPLELWAWARTTPSKQLVVAVFDPCRDRWPAAGPSDPLAEGGRGLSIIAAVSDEWGAHPSRSRLGPWRVPGKAVWSAFSIPGPWPDTELHADPARTARSLVASLTDRGIEGVGCRHERGVSLVIVPLCDYASLNVWVEPKALTFTDTNSKRIWRPILDLQDVSEHLVRRVEENGIPSP